MSIHQARNGECVMHGFRFGDSMKIRLIKFIKSFPFPRENGFQKLRAAISFIYRWNSDISN